MPNASPKACGIHGLFNGPRCPECFKKWRREADEQRAQEQIWRKWYMRLPWRDRSGKFGLRADTLRKHPVCNICHRVASTVADHIIPHKGVWAAFIDPNNLQGICKSCHDTKTGREGGFTH